MTLEVYIYILFIDYSDELLDKLKDFVAVLTDCEQDLVRNIDEKVRA